jgi:hypothetical protein
MADDRLKPARKASAPARSLARKIRKPPAHWLKPELRVDVEYRALTGEGELRHPSCKGVRKISSGCTRPEKSTSWTVRPGPLFRGIFALSPSKSVWRRNRASARLLPQLSQQPGRRRCRKIGIARCPFIPMPESGSGRSHPGLDGLGSSHSARPLRLGPRPTRTSRRLGKAACGRHDVEVGRPLHPHADDHS